MIYITALLPAVWLAKKNCSLDAFIVTCDYVLVLMDLYGWNGLSFTIYEYRASLEQETMQHGVDLTSRDKYITR